MKKNSILYEIRKEKNMTQSEFANWLKVPVKSYKTYENYQRVPRIKRAIKIVRKLKPYGVVSIAIFVVPDDISEDKSESVTANIARHMSEILKKKILAIHVTAIRYGEVHERESRPKDEDKINAYSKDGKKIVNERIAKMANERLGINTLTAKDVLQYKYSKNIIYQDKHGKCAWGLPEMRERLGFNRSDGLVTGYDRKKI